MPFASPAIPPRYCVAQLCPPLPEDTVCVATAALEGAARRLHLAALAVHAVAVAAEDAAVLHDQARAALHVDPPAGECALLHRHRAALDVHAPREVCRHEARALGPLHPGILGRRREARALVPDDRGARRELQRPEAQPTLRPLGVAGSARLGVLGARAQICGLQHVQHVRRVLLVAPHQRVRGRPKQHSRARHRREAMP